MSADTRKKLLDDALRGAKAVVGLAGEKKKEESASKPDSGFVEYTGGDAQLDKAIAGYSKQYAQGREKALAGDPRGLTEMRNANDSANQLRNAKGYAAQFADQDIAYVKGQMGEGRESGKGSGLGGQAQLALSNNLQGTLNELSAREADALGRLELERAQAEVDYNAALAQAQSEGDYELARQLYDEKVRQDEELAQWAKWQAQQDYQNSYFDWQRQQARRSEERQEALAEAKASGESEEQLREMLFQYAQSTGDYGSLEAYYTPQQIARLEEQWRSQRDQAARGEQAQELEQARREAEWAAKYGDYAALKALGVDTGYLERTQAAQLAQLAAKETAGKSTSTGKSAAYKPKFTVSQLDKAIDNGRITDQVKRDFRYYYGVDYDAFFETGEGNAARKPAVSEANFAIAMNTLTAMMRDGDYDMAQRGVAGLEGRLTPSQRERLEELMAELEKKYPKKRTGGSGTR